MLVFGGQKKETSCGGSREGSSTFGMFLLDLTKLEWQDKYPEDASSNYEVAGAVQR